MKQHQIIIAALATLATLSSRADVLELKDGKTLNGKYVGGTAGTIRFETSAGVQVIETGQALALTFTGAAAVASATSTPAAAQSPAASAAPTASAPKSVTVPAGTLLLVRTVDPVSSSDPQGKRFTAKLDADLTVNDILVAKAGTKVYGRVESAKQARRYSGQSELDIRLTELATGPTLVPLMTSGFTEEGARSGGKVVRSAAAGAAIGAIADENQGAGKGAAIGAVSAGVKRGEPVVIRPGTLLEFTLQNPVTITAAQ